MPADTAFSSAPRRSDRRKRAILAAFLSLLVPGFGQVYNGEAGRAGKVWWILILCYAAFIAFSTRSLPLAAAALIALLCAELGAFLDAFPSKRTERNPIRWYNRGRYYVLYIVMVSWLPHLLLGTPARRWVVEAFKMPASSMDPTLRVGDHFIVDKTAYRFGSVPTRGDIVVLTLPDNPATGEDESNTNIVKRVVATGGDTVEVRGTTLLLNGKPLEEPYAVYIGGGRKDIGPLLVPSGMLFLLGDNRDQSKDSRYWLEPFLDPARVKGKARYIYWNPEQSGRFGVRLG